MSGSQISSSTTHVPPKLIIAIGGKTTGELAIEALGQEEWQAVRQKLQEAEGQIEFNVISMPQWTEFDRSQLFTLGREFHVVYQGNGQLFNDAFDAALSQMSGNACMSTHKQSLDCAIHAAAILHHDAPESAAGKINERLQQLGAPKLNARQLASRIRRPAVAPGEEESNQRAEPKRLAVAFLDDLAKKLDLNNEVPPLWFYQGDFYAWTGKRWQKLEDQKLFAQVMGFLQRLSIAKLTERTVRDVISHLKGHALLDCWDESMPFYVAEKDGAKIEHPHLMTFSNGIVDLGKALSNNKKPPKLLDFDPRWFNSILLPYAFDPKAKCPLWLETVGEILPPQSKKDKRQKVLQEYMGYSLLTDCRFQKFMVLIGDGGNGKSTVTETWQAMLGEGNVAAVGLEALGDDYRQWALKDKLANFSGELSYLGKINEGNLKRIVSGEPVDANRKHRDPIKLRLHAKLIVNTNDMPKINDATTATWDRMIVIPFLERFRGTNKDDKDRPAKLQAELPGTFMWAFKGLARLLANGKFTKCEICSRFTNQHRTESDSVLAFIDDCCVPSQGHVLFSRCLYELYRYYCSDTGRSRPFGEAEFGKRMIRAGHEKFRACIQPNGKRPNAYRDIDLGEHGGDLWKAIKYKCDFFTDEDELPKIGYQDQWSES